ncbi:hypothetical protein PQX77_019999, partial [Marasmius sp. AFHP31]
DVQEASGQIDQYWRPGTNGLNIPAFDDAISGTPYHPTYSGVGTVAMDLETRGNAENSMPGDCSTDPNLLLWPEHIPQTLDFRQAVTSRD